MGPRIKVCVHARDPVSRAGVLAELRPRPEVDLVEDDLDAEVAVVVADRLDEESERVIRALRRRADARVVAVLADVENSAVLAAVEAGANGLLRRADADAERLVRAIRASARGDGSIPPDLLGRLFSQIGRLQNQVLVPRGLTLAGVTEREVEVLRLVAEGLDTTEIASKLAYSERTIKNILHDVVARYGLRNRAHAVAYALREGLI
jgi:DNA-binding NarL/FixJ family response regulator